MRRYISTIIFIIIFIVSCKSNPSMKNNYDKRFSEPGEPYISYYLDYDNFTDTLLTQVDLHNIVKNRIKNYIRTTMNKKGLIIKREWFYNSKLRMVEYYNNKGIILSQILKISKNEYVKRVFHYISGKLFKINIYMNNELNAIIEHFYNNKLLVKKHKYNENYKITTKTFIRYTKRNKIRTQVEYLYQNGKKAYKIKEYIAKYKNGKIMYDVEYLYNRKGKFKHFSRYFDTEGKIKAGILFSSKYRGKVLFKNKYKNGKILYSWAYYYKGRAKSVTAYSGHRAAKKTGFSNRGRIIFQNRFDDMGREISTPES